MPVRPGTSWAIAVHRRAPTSSTARVSIASSSADHGQLSLRPGLPSSPSPSSSCGWSGASAAVGFARPRLRRRAGLLAGALGDAAATIASAAARPPRSAAAASFTSSTSSSSSAGVPASSACRHCSTITTATGTEGTVASASGGSLSSKRLGDSVLGLREPLLVALPCDVCCAAGLGASSASTPQPGFARASRPRIRCGDVDISRSASMVDSDASVACAIAARVKFVDDWRRSAPQG